MGFYYCFTQDDCLLKVWYPMTGWKSSLLPQENEENKKCPGIVHFSFVYLAHPRAVTGFSWRNISKYMPRFESSLFLKKQTFDQVFLTLCLKFGHQEHD